MKTRTTFGVGASTLGSMLALACGGGGGATSHDLPWEQPRTQILKPDGSVAEVAAASGQSCIDYHVAAGDCIKPQMQCGDMTASDIVVDEQGKPIDIICYPRDSIVTVTQIEAQQGEVKQNENNSAIVLDDANDGVDLMGNLHVDANNVIVYGQGPAVSVISGDVSVDGNNTIIRGVTIEGAVDIVKNNAVLLDCVIRGDVTIEANDARIARCDIFGSVHITGNGASVTATRVTGDFEARGNGASCVDDYHANDANKDGAIASTEVGTPITCGGNGKK